MTANMIKGKGFRGALRYNLEKIAKGVAEVLDHSFVNVSEKTILKEIQMVKVLRPNLRKFFYHTSINFPPGENLSNAIMLQIGQDYLRESGFTQNQYIMFRHYDANHPHLHILVNRIDYNGKVLSDSNDFANCEMILRGLEKKYNLTKVISSKQAVNRAVTKDELEMMKRTQSPSYKVQLHKIIKDVLSIKPNISCSEFIQALQKKDVNVRFNIASTGYVSGISYSYKNMIVTGTKLGNDFKWTMLRNKLDYEQERDHAIIQQANGQTHEGQVNSGTGSKSKQSENVIEVSTALDLRSWLTDFSIGDIFRGERQPDDDPEKVLGLNRKRKKRRKRLGR
jgi:hypothetical protein